MVPNSLSSGPRQGFLPPWVPPLVPPEPVSLSLPLAAAIPFRRGICQGGAHTLPGPGAPTWKPPARAPAGTVPQAGQPRGDGRPSDTPSLGGGRAHLWCWSPLDSGRRSLRPPQQAPRASAGPGVGRLTVGVTTTARARARGHLLHPAEAPTPRCHRPGPPPPRHMCLGTAGGREAACLDPPRRARVGALVLLSGKQLPDRAAVAGGNSRNRVCLQDPSAHAWAGSVGTPTAGIPGQGRAPRKLGQRLPRTRWSGPVPAAPTAAPFWGLPSGRGRGAPRPGALSPGPTRHRSPSRGETAGAIITLDAPSNLRGGFVPLLYRWGN